MTGGSERTRVSGALGPRFLYVQACSRNTARNTARNTGCPSQTLSNSRKVRSNASRPRPPRAGREPEFAGTRGPPPHKKHVTHRGGGATAQSGVSERPTARAPLGVPQEGAPQPSSASLLGTAPGTAPPGPGPSPRPQPQQADAPSWPGSAQLLT